jgi:hypothetical protein
MTRASGLSLLLSGVLLLSGCGAPAAPPAASSAGTASVSSSAFAAGPASSAASGSSAAPASACPASGASAAASAPGETDGQRPPRPGLTALDLGDTLTGRTLQADLDGDGTREQVRADVTALDPSALPEEERAAANRPVTVSLTVNGVRLSWEERWNDGVSVSLQTLGETEGGRDLCVRTSGTDVSFTLAVFRWNGRSGTLWEAARVESAGPAVYCDGQGTLYSFDTEWSGCDLRACGCENPTRTA